MTHPHVPNAPRRVLQTVLYWATLLACAVLFMGFARGVASDALGSFDAYWLGLLATVHGSFWDRFFLTFTQLGGGLALVVYTVVAALVAWPRRKSEAIFLSLATLGAGLLNHVTKTAFARARPTDPYVPFYEAGGYAFPSGHSMVTAAFLVALALALHHARPGHRALLWPLTALLIVLMGVSRAYLHVHFPSDVVAGWAFGVTWALGLNVIFVRYRREGGVA